ncbi:hypothetical protein ABB37_09766 [Leptomonas pyrrhocoris]|uniref:RRM domain-containing protein n=1 Tax=Leptomonas pyrrhocoris TaxID=157538 RepID=A0A0N0DQW9_LEPPY|nr:hypothetical protein ABB37_09766 [Leptomonas pyrrhocoris]KPA73634.1 hypothetical protein ABB37_09766 [Leptomonas pyrrhocoris]|eukprot:XP_015652073.1 hypothetical protein ABB37_09766 [Leptomonas pyrrhocoris]
MSDSDWRGERDARADRYGGDARSDGNPVRGYGSPDGSGGGGGRYNRALQRRDGHNDSHGSRRRSTSRERDTSTAAVDGNKFYADDGNYRPHQRPRYDGGYGNAWQQQQQQAFMAGGDFDYAGGNAYGMPQNMGYNNGYPFYDMMAPQQQQFDPNNNNNSSNLGGMMPYGMAGFNMNMNSNNGMDTSDLLQFLLQQQQQQQQQQPHSDSSGHPLPLPDTFHGVSNNEDPNAAARVPNSAPAAARVLPSVDEFVPVVPKSLLSLVRGGPSTASPGPEGGDGNGANARNANNNNGSDPAGSPAGTLSAGGGAMVLLEAPKIAPEVDRRAREQRRAHISGFPINTTRDSLEHYFRVLLPEVRRMMTEREIRQLAEETGLIQEEGEEAVRHIPPNANLSNIDEIRELTLNQGRRTPFSFMELRLADMIDELVRQCEADPQRFLFTAADGSVWPLTIRRPRDTQPLTGVEESKIVLVGIPATIPADAVRGIFENAGEVLSFEFSHGYAYGEFAELRAATEFRADVHGYVFGNTMAVALPLHDWLKALLVREGLDIAIADDDPVSGSYVMKQVRERMPDTTSLSGAANRNAAGGAMDGGAAGAKSTALVLAEDPAAASLQVMRELLDMSFSLPNMLARFAALHPHLRPLYANTQVTVYPTPVLVLLNLFDEEELVHDAAYSRLLADIEEEVENFGRVRRLIVPRREGRPKLPEAPKPGEDYDEDDAAAKEAAIAAYNEAKKNFGAVLGRYMNRQTHPVWGGYGRVFVEYETVDEAAEAQQQIAGKLFGGRTVITSFLFPDLLKEDGEEEEEAEAEDNAADAEAEAEAPPKKEESHHNDGGDDDDDALAAAVDADTSVAHPESNVGGAEAGEEDDDVAASATSEHAEDID